MQWQPLLESPILAGKGLEKLGQPRRLVGVRRLDVPGGLCKQVEQLFFAQLIQGQTLSKVLLRTLEGRLALPLFEPLRCALPAGL
jgi:hypothetical protein